LLNRVTIKTPSHREPTISGSETAETGGQSMRMRSYFSKPHSSILDNRAEASNSDGFLGIGPEQTKSRLAMDVFWTMASAESTCPINQLDKPTF